MIKSRFDGVIRRALLTCSVGVLFAGCQADPASEVAKAEADFAAGDLRTATVRVRTALKADPNNADAHVLRGRIALAGGDAAFAASEFERVLALGGSDDDVALYLADALIRSGEPDRALTLLADVVDSPGAQLPLLKGEALLRAGRLIEAEAELNRSAEIGGPSSRLLTAQAQLLSLRDDPVAAEALLNGAIDAAKSPLEEADALSSRAAYFLGEQELEAAVADMQAAAELYRLLSLSAREATVLAMLVQGNLTLNRLDAAAEAAERIAAIAPDAAVSDYARGLVAYERGRFDEAVARLQSAVTEDPRNPRFLTLLGAAHLAHGNLGQAEQQLRAALAVTPDDPAAAKLLAETQIRQQRPAAALESLDMLHDDSDPALGALRGLASLQSGKLDEAAAHLEQALANNPANQSLRLELARVYLASGRDDSALDLLDGLSTGDEALAANVMSLFAYLRAEDLAMGRQSAERLVERFPGDARALAASAMFYQLAGERATAEQRLREAVQADPQFVPARLVLAGMLGGEGRYPEADRLLREVLELAPDHASALALLGEFRARQGELDQAEQLLVHASEVSPSPQTHLTLARLNVRQGDYDSASEHIEAARRLAPENVEVTAAEGVLALATGRAQEAVALLDDARQAFPSRPDIALALAQAQAAADDLPGARDTLALAAESAPADLAIRYALGESELRLGNGDAALDLARAMQEDFPQRSAGYSLEGEARLAQRRYVEAAENFDSAFERDPVWRTLARRVLALQLADRQADVETALREWVSDQPEHLAGRLLLAEAIQSSGQAQEAIAAYNDILKLWPDDVVALNNAAWLYHETGTPGALDLARRAAELAPGQPAVLDTLGWILALDGQGARALDYLQRAAEAAPQQFDIHYHLGYTLAQLGRVSEAEQVLRKIVVQPQPFATKADAEALLESL